MLNPKFGGVQCLTHFGTHLLNSFRMMTQNKCTSHQLLGLFTSIPFKWYLFISWAPKHRKSCNSVQWVIWCGHLAMKSRVHAAAHQARTPWRAVFKLWCCRKLASRATILHSAWKVPYWWGPGGKRSSDGLVVRAHVCYLCQNRPKTEPEHPPRPPKTSVSPQIMPAAYLYDTLTVCIQKGACPEFCSVGPSGQILVSEKWIIAFFNVFKCCSVN